MTDGNLCYNKPHRKGINMTDAINDPLLDSIIKNIVGSSLKILATVPQMNTILQDLPENLTYGISEKTPGAADFDVNGNKITIHPQRVDFKTAQGQLNFLLTLAHELCHANQKKIGLYFDDLSNASFGDTFRVAKMMEIEAWLLRVIIENELLKKTDFTGCSPSVECQYYRQKLQQFDNDISKANAAFVLGWWQNLKGDQDAQGKIIKDVINEHYFFYVEQAYHQALTMHNPMYEKYRKKSFNMSFPYYVMAGYLNRMHINDMNPAVFLQNEFDNAVVGDNFEDGVTVLYFNGDKYMNIQPTQTPTIDTLTYFNGGQVSTVFLRNGITKETKPIPMDLRIDHGSGIVRSPKFITAERTGDNIDEGIMRLSALNIAIENNDMKKIKIIVLKDPSIINRQMPAGHRFPILMAIQSNKPDAVKFFLDLNANLLLETEDGKTVLTELSNLTDTALQSRIKFAYAAQQRDGYKENKRFLPRLLKTLTF